MLILHWLLLMIWAILLYNQKLYLSQSQHTNNLKVILSLKILQNQSKSTLEVMTIKTGNLYLDYIKAMIQKHTTQLAQ